MDGNGFDEDKSGRVNEGSREIMTCFMDISIVLRTYRDRWPLGSWKFRSGY